MVEEKTGQQLENADYRPISEEQIVGSLPDEVLKLLREHGTLLGNMGHTLHLFLSQDRTTLMATPVESWKEKHPLIATFELSDPVNLP